MDSNYENAILILKAMVERSRVWTSNGDVIRKITNLQCNEINEAVHCLEKKGLINTLAGRSKMRYDFFNVSLSDEGYKYYKENIGKIESIE